MMKMEMANDLWEWHAATRFGEFVSFSNLKKSLEPTKSTEIFNLS